LEKAKVTVVGNVEYPTELKLRLPSRREEKTPCGLNCLECSAYKQCTGAQLRPSTRKVEDKLILKDHLLIHVHDYYFEF
jgi:hypothetical protein